MPFRPPSPLLPRRRSLMSRVIRSWGARGLAEVGTNERAVPFLLSGPFGGLPVAGSAACSAACSMAGNRPRLLGQRTAGLQERLEVRQDRRPAAGGVGELALVLE